MALALTDLSDNSAPQDSFVVNPDCLGVGYDLNDSNVSRLISDDHIVRCSRPFKPQSISFLQLPREIRDLVYAELLAASGGILFSPYGFHQHGPPRLYHLKGRDASLARSETRRQASNAWLSTTILRVNRQVSEEAAEVLYGKNAFVFSAALVHTVQFFFALPAKHLRAIRHLTFQKRLFMPLYFDNSPSWEKLYPIIEQRMALDTVTLFPPLEPFMYDPSTTATPAWRLRTLLADDAHQFWWPSAKFFASLLMSHDHPLKKIRLVWPGFEDKGLAFPPRIKASLDVEALRVIQILRVPRREGDEVVEDGILESLKESGQHGAFTRRVWADWHDTIEAREAEKHAFVVRREKSGEGEGVVLALQPPSRVLDAKIG